MSNTIQDQGFLVGKFYTAARRFKQLIGVAPDGTVIPGGPYTVTQFVLLVLTFCTLWLMRNMGLWGNQILVDLVIMAAVSIGVGWIAGKIPSTRRNPLRMLNGVYAALTYRKGGYWKGQPLVTMRMRFKPHATMNPVVHQEEPPSVDQKIENSPLKVLAGGLDRLNVQATTVQNKA